MVMTTEEKDIVIYEIYDKLFAAATPSRSLDDLLESDECDTPGWNDKYTLSHWKQFLIMVQICIEMGLELHEFDNIRSIINNGTPPRGV